MVKELKIEQYLEGKLIDSSLTSYDEGHFVDLGFKLDDRRKEYTEQVVSVQNRFPERLNLKKIFDGLMYSYLYYNLLNHFKSFKGKKILELECGTGEFLYILGMEGAVPYGMDETKDEVDVANHVMGSMLKGVPRIHICKVSDALPFEGQFDAVISHNTLVQDVYHWDELKAIIDRLSGITPYQAHFAYSDNRFPAKDFAGEKRWVKNFSYDDRYHVTEVHRT